MNEFEKFYGKIWKQGDSLVFTIPSSVVKFAGYKEGDDLEIMSKKKVKE